MFGFTTGYARELLAAGTPNVSSLYRPSITEAVRLVDVGDVLEIADVGRLLMVRRAGVDVGALNIPRDVVVLPAVLQVQRVFVNDDVVVNLGGIVTRV